MKLSEMLFNIMNKRRINTDAEWANRMYEMGEKAAALEAALKKAEDNLMRTSEALEGTQRFLMRQRQINDETKQALKDAEKREAELREDILTRIYRRGAESAQLAVANICYEELDKSGALLARIRDNVWQPSALKETADETNQDSAT
jgi:Skp family chaperone for outer membrane proteins